MELELHYLSTTDAGALFVREPGEFGTLALVLDAEGWDAMRRPMVVQVLVEPGGAPEDLVGSQAEEDARNAEAEAAMAAEDAARPDDEDE